MDYREKVEAIRQDQIERCRSSIDFFIDNYGHIEDKDSLENGGIAEFKMWDAQREALHSIMSHRWNVILKARQLGFSWLMLHVAAHTLLFPGKTVIGLSRTEEEAKELVRRLGVIFTYMPELIAEKGFLPVGWQGITFSSTSLVLTVTFPNKQESVFKAFPSSPGAGRSFTANLIIFDEWAFQQFAEEIWQGGFPTINRPSGGKVIGLSTIERGSFFEQVFTDPDNGFNKIFIPWYADPRRDKEWYEKTKRALGDLITAEYPATIEEALMVPGGAYFPEVTRDTHETEQEPQGKVRRYVSIDYGLDCFAAIWYTIDLKGHAQAYRECSEPNLTISQAAELLHYLSAGEHIDAYLAPPDLWNRRQETGKSVADIMRENDIVLVKTSNDIFNGCMMMKEWLRVREDGTPDLTFLKDACPKTINCLQKIQKDKHKPKIYAKQPHDITHLCMTGDTLVMTTKGYRRLDKVKRGNKVFCIDDNGNIAKRKIEYACMTSPDAEIYEVELEDGTIIKATADHKIMTDRGFKCISELNVNDEVSQVSVEKYVLNDIPGYNTKFCNTLSLKRFFRRLGRFVLLALK